MKYGITLFVSLLFNVSLFGQAPANDECVNAVDFGIAPACDETVFTNVDATNSNIGTFNLPDCWAGDTDGDVWFAFTDSDTIEDYRISVIGEAANGDPAIFQPQVQIYRGSCGIDMLAPTTACGESVTGSNDVFVDFLGADNGLTYYIRVNDNGSPGSFRLCVEERPPTYTIDETGAVDCSGFLFDTGGPNGNYGSNEDHTFTICPTGEPACINLSLEYFNFETGTDGLTIYDGDAATGVPIADLNSFDSPSANAGGVCFQASASSGCMTLQFQSNAGVTFEGFSAFWECSEEPCDVAVPLSVNSDVTAEDVADAIAGAQTQLEITNINCPDGHYGIFEATDDELGLGQGLILSSGEITNAIGPNDQFGIGTALFAPGDDDLDSLNILTGGDPFNTTEDACIVEFDVFANTQELVFEYVFGSEEYPEFVELPGSSFGFNDIFAFFISGPGIVGEPALGGQENIAVLPDGTTVEINRVNEGLNWQYYRNNSEGQSIQYDGLTSDSLGVKKSLTARRSVTPCKNYRIKLAVADRGDSSYDSGVFISDVRGGAPQASVDFVTGVDYLVEDCIADTPDTLIISLDNILPDSVTYVVNIGGTATLGLDYILGLPPTLTFPPGSSQLLFPITVLSDLLDEGVETIEISFAIDFGCGLNNVSSLIVEIRDDLEIEVNLGADTVIYCAGNEIPLSATGAETFVWTPADIFVEPTGASVTAMPVGDVEVIVTGTLGSCTAMDTVQLIGVDPMIEIMGGDELAVCNGDTLTLFQTNNVEGSNLQWNTFFQVLNGLDEDSLIVIPNFSGNISVSVELAGCVATDDVQINFGNLNIPEVIEDITICQGETIQPGSIGFTGDTQYEWTPGDDFVDPTDPNSILIPTELEETYTLISTSANGSCADTQSVTITLIPGSIQILNPDTIEVCAGFDSVVLRANVSPFGSDISWSPNAGILTNWGDSISVRPDITVLYTASLITPGCVRSDTVVVKVDSLPQDMSITLQPFEDPYCQGDTFFLLSPIFDVGDFSDITHMWMDAPGLQTGDSLYNGFVVAQDTSLFMRFTENGACSQLDTVQVNVITPPVVTIMPQDTTVCPGTSYLLDLEILEGAVDSIGWSPAESLSCTDCEDPIATPTQSTNYMVVLRSEGSDCTFPFSATASIVPPLELDVVDEVFVCPGDPAVPFVGTPDPNTTYTVVGPGIDSEDPLVEIVSEGGEYVYTAFGLCDTVMATATIILREGVIMASLDGPDEICISEEAQYELTIDGENNTVNWDLNGIAVSVPVDETTLSIGLSPGTNVLTVTIDNGCDTLVLTQTTEALPEPSVELPTNTTICLGDNITLNLNPDATSTYSWTGPNGFSSSEAAPSVSPTETSTYSFTAVIGDCEQSGEVTIEVIQDYVLNPIDDLLVCFGESAFLAASTTPADVLGGYNWIIENGDPATATGPEVNDVTFDVTGIFNYSVTFSDANSCFDPQTQTATIEVLEDLEAPQIIITDANGNLLEPGSAVFNGEVITFTADNQSGFDYSFAWSGNGDPASGTGPAITATVPAPDGETGLLTYTLTYTSREGGCSGTIGVSLVTQQATFAIPELITPNNDGVNDIFRLFYNGVVTDYQMLVFNRWGQVVFETNDPEQGWDGETDGEPQAMDVYLYRTKFNQNGVAQERDGQFSLVR
ncbi:hypothetical protein CEQ90_04285 [Lewinellaceae bacterium SD302]|nr:hypothetical protein CEQ90_04285 [Lewinellaceae bacterium SD302]